MTSVHIAAASGRETFDMQFRPETYWPEIADRARSVAARCSRCSTPAAGSTRTH